MYFVGKEKIAEYGLNKYIRYSMVNPQLDTVNQTYSFKIIELFKGMAYQRLLAVFLNEAA
jgi:hypothetical protein